jgi:Family of unknown function (DUF5305)
MRGQILLVGFLAPWLDRGRKSRSGDSWEDDLEEKIKPYLEVILVTTTPPSKTQIEVQEWKDVVRASDTLGKPILRWTRRGGPPGTVFYVADGPVCYVFDARPLGAPEHPPESPDDGRTLDPPAPGPAELEWVGPPPMLEGELRRPPGPRDHEAPPAFLDREQRLRDLAYVLLARLRDRPGAYPNFYPALLEFRQALGAMRVGSWDDAEERLETVRSLLNPGVDRG